MFWSMLDIILDKTNLVLSPFFFEIFWKRLIMVENNKISLIFVIFGICPRKISVQQLFRKIITSAHKVLVKKINVLRIIYL